MRFVAGIVLLFAFFLTPSLLAQQVYKGWPLSARVEEEESKKAAAIANALQAGSIDKATFDAYFTRYYFNRWTLPDRISLLNGYVRNDFFKNDLGRATGEARRMLLDVTVRAMRRMKSDPNVYPVAQLNALVVLGNLYEDPGKTTPYGPAIPVLIEEFRRDKAPLANQIAALDGLVRYAYLGIADSRLRDQELPALFIAVVTEEEVPEGRDEEIHTLFFRARAVEGLGALCRNAKPAPGESAESLTAVVETLLTILESRTEKNEVRNNAMNAFAELNLIAASAGGVELDPARIVDAIVSFARMTCDRQQRVIDEARRSEQASTSGGMGRGMGTMSGGMGPMGGGMGPMVGGMGTMGGGMGTMGGGMGTMGLSSGNDKMIRRTEECIGSSKFAFGVVKNAIRGLSGSRNETSIIALLNKENAAANAGTVRMLQEIEKNIDEYITFLNKGPPVNRRQQTQQRGVGTPMMGGPLSAGSTTTAARGTNMPRVTMDDIHNELTVLATKFDELKNRG